MKQPMNRGVITGAIFLLGVAAGVVGTRLFWRETEQPVAALPTPVRPAPVVVREKQVTQTKAPAATVDLRPQVAELEKELTATRAELRKARNETVAANTFAAAAVESLVGRDQRQATGTNDAWTTEDVGVFIGDFNRRVWEFEQKYPAGIPTEGTPEAEAYQAAAKEFAKEMSEALTKFPDFSSVVMADHWQELTRMQTGTLGSSLDLNENQIQQVMDAYSRAYQDAARRNLFKESQPTTGFESWHQQRTDLARQVSAQISAVLTESQKAVFQKRYPDPLWSLTVCQPGGGVY